MKRAGYRFALFEFILGIAFGIIIVIVAAVVFSRMETDKELTNRARTFGDIKVWAQEAVIDNAKIPKVLRDLVDVNETSRQRNRELLMALNDIPFLIISQNKTGKIDGLYLNKYNMNKYDMMYPVLFLSPSGIPGKWKNAFYSEPNGTGKAVGDVFIDIDFDGRFDSKMTMGDNGRPASRYIYI